MMTLVASLRQRIAHLEYYLTEIKEIALLSEGVEFYAMLAEKGLAMPEQPAPCARKHRPSQKGRSK